MGQATAERTAPATYVYKKQEDVQKKVGGYTQQQQKVKELTYEERLKKLQKYEPVIPQAPTDMKFHYYKEDGSLGIRAKLKMIESVDELKEFAKRCVGRMVGLDTETTGLTFYKDKIVGFSLALTDMEGYYVPIRHQIRHTTTVKENKVDENGNYVLTKTGKISTHTVKTHTYEPSPYNLPDKECLDILYEIMLNAKVSLWHNSNFDLNMLKAEGYDVMKCKTFDTLVLPYIYDAEGRGISGLKDLEKRLLGRYRPGFKEVVGSDENFQYTDPSVSYEYAAIDACHDEQTEVLTQKGWVLWKDYDGTTPLATSNLETNHFEWQLPTRVIKYPYEGNMYYYKNKTQDWCVTPNHNMLVHRSQDVAKPVEYKRADSLNVEETIYTGATEKQGKQQEYQIGDYTISEVDLARLTALILADGWTQKYDAKTHRSYDTGIVYSENKNYMQISSFLKHLAFPKVHIYETTTEVNSVRLYHWTTHYKPLWDLMRPYTEGGSKGKYVPEFIKEMSAEAIREFITFYGYCDGHRQVYKEGCNTFSMCICTVSPYLRDDLQELLCMVGIPSMLGSRPSKGSCIKGRIIPAENCAEQYFIQYNSRKTKRIKKPSMQIIPYKGMVYCAEVPNHTLITRRNGKVLVSGNCSTIAIYNKLYPMVKDLLAQAPSIIELDGKKYNIVQEDNNLIRAFVDYYDHAELKVDPQVARDYEKVVKEGLAKTSAEIYEFFGRGPFSLSTQSKEFQKVMQDYHIETGAVTDKGNKAFGKKGVKEFNKNLNYLKNTVFPNVKYLKFNENKQFGSKLPKKDQATRELNSIAYTLTGIIKTYGKDYCKWVDQVNNLVIKNLDGSMATRMDFYEILKKMYHGELAKLNVLKKVQQVSSYNKALNSYISKLTEVESCRLKYNVTSTSSSRLSGGLGKVKKGQEDTYFINLNPQNLVKPTQVAYRAYPSNEPGNILGWKYEQVSSDYAHANKDKEIIVEAGTPTTNIRKCFVAPEGTYIASLDFSNEEARILALLSQDPRMLNIFLTGEDMHTSTAVAIFGEDGHDKKYRKIAKAINFAMAYQGNEYTIANNLDIPIEEARGYVEAYYEKFATSIRWKKQQIQHMYQQGGKVYTMFGRPRQFITRLKSASTCGDDKISQRIQSAVERRVPSHIVQGLAGDVCRYILLKLYRKYFKHRDKNCAFLSTVHDEVNFAISKEMIIPYLRDIQEIMTFRGIGGQFPLEVSIDIGNNYGQCFPYKWGNKERTILVPDRM